MQVKNNTHTKQKEAYRNYPKKTTTQHRATIRSKRREKIGRTPEPTTTQLNSETTLFLEYSCGKARTKQKDAVLKSETCGKKGKTKTGKQLSQVQKAHGRNLATLKERIVLPPYCQFQNFQCCDVKGSEDPSAAAGDQKLSASTDSGIDRIRSYQLLSSYRLEFEC
ncbi:uncharacterized protein LOC120016474 [Tripterygium wilfordii]|uniref:uncharacterized protein LOC120016474 n=1 Tax=Tripterygium wilfordii TaxID=458696 RepID=UPI0018F82325|nr:uncharacterized protein LOC120016474 [Tripterygium wilfordii]